MAQAQGRPRRTYDNVWDRDAPPPGIPAGTPARPEVIVCSLWLHNAAEARAHVGVHFDRQQLQHGDAGGTRLTLLLDNGTIAFLNGKNVDMTFRAEPTADGNEMYCLDAISVLGRADVQQAPQGANQTEVVSEAVSFADFIESWKRRHTLPRDTVEGGGGGGGARRRTQKQE
jgi:hypothetical protein